jgi:predicted aspartyl protease
MGQVNLELEIANAARPDVFECLNFLIDSGANHSVAPRDVLERLGIPPLTIHKFRLVTWQTIERQIGAAVFRHQGRVGAATVVFGESGDMTLLGTQTLEALHFGLNPINHELIELPMLL